MNIAIIGAGNVGKALADSIKLDAMAELTISLQIRHQWPRQNGWKLVGPSGD
jgi:predicted dinucleotide-binding enzyme